MMSAPLHEMEISGCLVHHFIHISQNFVTYLEFLETFGNLLKMGSANYVSVCVL